MQEEIYKDVDFPTVYAVMRDNCLMAFDESFLMLGDYRFADYRTSPDHWKKHNVTIPKGSKVVKVHKTVIIAVEEI